MNTAIVLRYLYIEQPEALKYYDQGSLFMRSKKIMRKQKQYEYH